jgi:amino acid adenylation domain-containing protein/non-ribosomal peptide synthase protein (TIGR01720 family)
MNLKDNIENIFPLTPLQKGLLFHSLYNPESAVYFEQLNCRLSGNVSIATVNQAWQTLIDRHSILRTAIITKGQSEPVQVVFRKIVFQVIEQDWRGLNTSAQENRLQQFLAEDRRQGFVLNRPPLMRVTLIRLDEQSWQMVWSHHHLLLDGWSMQLLMREFFLLHQAACKGVEALLPPVRPYGDFLAWLRQKNPHAGESFWRDYLRGFDSRTPLSMIPAKKQSNLSKSVEIRLQVNSEETACLQKLARSCSVTLNTIIQGAWAILLNRYSRSEDIVYGVTVAGRPSELSGVEGMIGPFINTLPLRVFVSGQALNSWLQMLQQQQIQIREFEHSSLVDIQSWSDVPRGQTLFESLLAFENFPVDQSLKAEDFGLNITDVSFFETTNYPITLVVVPGDELLFKLTYDSQRFDGAGMELLLEQLHHLLMNMAHNAKASLTSLSLLSGDRTANMTNLSLSSPHNKEMQGTIATNFATAASQYPQRIAVTFGQETLTYQELDRRSNKIARFLQKQGIGPDQRVIICLERSFDLIIAMLGVVKAGGTYVPVDPKYPQERIEFTVIDCEAELILTTTLLSSLLPKSVPTVCLDTEDAPYLTESDAPVSIDRLKPEDGAYIIYTSGSTGKPKGVLVTQNNVTRLFSSTKHWFEFNENDVWTFFHSFAFDFSVWEIWGALFFGGRLVIVPYVESRDPQKFLQLLQQQKVTILNQTPSAFTQLLALENTSNSQALTQLRFIIFGGEALNLQSLRPWFDRYGEKTRLVNMYGITETTVHVTYRPISRQDLENASGSLIGEPIPDLQIYLLDPHGNLLPPGVTGEIYVGGAGVTRGYFNRPEINGQRFVPHPFSPSSARLYRSGDLARFLPNGDLEYLGRIDDQVKIRGFRIEIGEIEAVLSQVPEVRENIVVVHSGDDHEKQLIAYLVCNLGTQPSIETLRNHLQQSLPDYMVPSRFIYLDKFPLTPNGKIDRKALPKPEFSRENLAVSFVPPETEEEQILAKIWQQVLGVNRVGRLDNYFALGGDSIRSIRVCSLAEAAGLKLKLEQVFSHPILSELAASVVSEKSGFTAGASDEKPFRLIASQDFEKLQEIAVDAYPLAQLQAGMLFHSDYSEGATAYNDVFSFRMRMPFDLKVWQQAYTQMFARHQVLRTAFYLGEFSQPLQAILKEVPTEIQFTDLTSLSESEYEAYLQSFIEQERENKFDWSKAPLVRFYLHQLDQNIVQATFALHHAIMDGWSLAQFMAELIHLYLHLLDGKVPSLPAPPTLQYSRFVALEQQALADENQRSFWQKQLADIPFTQLPRLPGKLNKELPGQMAKIDIALSQQLSQQMKALSNQLGVPLRTVLLAVHLRLLAFYSGEEEVVTGLVSNGRPEAEDGERVLGLFLNTVPFRLQLSGGSWVDLIHQTFRAEQTMMPHRRFPIAEIQRMHGGLPLYESSFNFVHFHVYKGLLELRDVELIQSQSFDETNIPFSVSWSEEVDSGRLLFNITYNRYEFGDRQVATIANDCEKMCAAVVADPLANYAYESLIGNREQETENRNPTSQSVHEIFESWAAKSPDLPAVSYEGQTWTYSELNQKANQLARFLRQYGIGTDKPVGICLERSLDMVCAILAVTKAGGCYVPIDPHYPPVRIQSMLQDAKASIVLTHSDLAVSTLNDLSTCLCLDTLDSEIARLASTNLEIPVLGEQIAYIIFTSGSTGRAKGIAISHHALANHMAWFLDTFAVNQSDVVLQKTPFSFDASVWEFWAALMTGAKLVMAKPGGHQDCTYLVETIKNENITLLQVVPTLLEILLSEPGFSECSSLRLVFSGGEALKQRVWDQFQKTLSLPLINLYGPAETTIDVAFHYCRDSENTATLPIGEAVPNTRLYILDRHLQPVPIGTPGELYVAGEQLARGYWNAPGLTAERFLPNPFSQNLGDRIYRTGDRARYLPDSTIEFLGRLDNQVKIRGFRIETNEIVTVLEQQPWVVQAVTKAHAWEDHPVRLVAFVELNNPPQNWQEMLRSCIRNTLPDYMVPSLFVSLDTWQLLPNGKIDLNALPIPLEEQVVRSVGYVSPRNKTEAIMTKIWEEVLRIPRVGIEDNFFELGGDSILCLQMIAKARALGIHFTPRDLFNHPQIIDLAANVTKSAPKQAVSLTPVGSEIPLTPVQQWFFQQSLVKPEHWNQAVLLDLKQDLDVADLRTALVQIAQNHEATKLRFRKTVNGWTQYIGDDGHILTFDVVDFSTLGTEELSKNIQAIATQFQTQLDLEHGPLFRAVYFQTEANTPNKLLLIIHHLIVDGVSWRVILQDLAIALQTGETANISSFAQWATQLDLLVDHSNWEKDLDFWKLQQASNPTLPLDFPERLEDNQEDSAAQIECHFSQSETESLLYELPRTRKARIQEVLLTVLLAAVTDWTQQSEMMIALESHGRESDFTQLDIFNSVGWFTSLFPLKLERKTDDLLKNLEFVKEQLRLPHNGFSYGLLSCRQEFADLLPKIPQGILFNYLGQFDENFPATAPFVPAVEDAGMSRAPENMRPFQLEVTGFIVNGKLQMRFVFSKALHREETIRHLAQKFYTCFLNLLEESNTQGESWTPADFPLASLDPKQLAIVTAGTSDVEDIYPLAPVQEGMLFHTNYESEAGVYLQQVTGEMRGVVDPAAFQQAWERCLQRHPSLRAAFVWQDLPRPLQRIHRRVNLPFVYEDWSALNTIEVDSQWNQLLKTDRLQGFSLETPPLMRLTLVRTEEQKWRFLWTHHHLLLDGWSLPLIFRDVLAFYCEEGIQHTPPFYRDFIAYLNAKESADAESFWRQELGGLQAATSLGLKSAQSSDYQTLQTTLTPQTYKQLIAVAQKNHVTLNTLVQAAWSLLLSRYSAANEVVFGVTVSGRPPELLGSSEMVGLFINTLPLRVAVDEATPLKQWLQTLRDRTSQINQYSFTRLVDIQGFCDIPRGQPLFESIVVYENYPVDDSLRQQESELSVSSVQSLEQTHYPVTLYALPGEEFTLKIAFQKNIGSEGDQEQMLHHLTQILRNFTEAAEFVGDIGLLSQTEVQAVVQAQGRSKTDTSKATVHELFSQQASLTPNAPAVLRNSTWLTYGELEYKSDQVAQVLQQLGITQETLVAVCLERHAGLLVALLGILKAGAAFVPLDPSFPRDRLDFMLADSAAQIIITEEKIASQLPASSVQKLFLDTENLTVSQPPESALAGVPGNNHLAYVIYTSGSTGRPKGVQIPHKALANFLLSFREQPGLSAHDTFVAVTTTTFDISILELFLPLIAGARLVVAERETARDGYKLAQLLHQSQATLMQATPATWRLLLTAGWQPNGSFRVLCGGEAMPVELAKSLLNFGVELWNVYGPTETTIWSTINQVKQPEDALSIGQAIANTSTYILDSAGNPVPQGVVGELFIGGDGVARGYRGRPNLTADRFVPNPFSQDPGGRLYRTGDLARFLPNGEIEFLSRLDYQVKIRGFRIELGEIETVLGNHPAISQAIVQPFEDTPTDKKLIAYLVAKPNAERLNPSNLRAYLLEKLPEYMIPSGWVYLDAMPLTPNNKVDRRALPTPTVSSREDYTAPRNAIEEALIEIWQELIQVEKVGVKDNFFDLGGHSLIAAQIHARIKKVFSIDLSLRELFASLTIEKVTQLLLTKETQPGRTEKIAKAFLRMKQMTPEEKAKLLSSRAK